MLQYIDDMLSKPAQESWNTEGSDYLKKIESFNWKKKMNNNCMLSFSLTSLDCLPLKDIFLIATTSFVLEFLAWKEQNRDLSITPFIGKH